MTAAKRSDQVFAAGPRNYRYNVHGAHGRFVPKVKGADASRGREWTDPQKLAFKQARNIPTLHDAVDPMAFTVLPKRSWLERLIRWYVWRRS